MKSSYCLLNGQELHVVYVKDHPESNCSYNLAMFFKPILNYQYKPKPD